MIIYLDTGPLVGLLNTKDQHHDQARSLFGQVKPNDTVLIPTTTITEFHRLILYRKPKDPATSLRVLERVMTTYNLVGYSEAEVSTALQTLRRFSDQGITLSDAILAAMAIRDAAEVMTFDGRHFSLMAARVYGSL